MLLILTIFDYTISPPRPLITAIRRNGTKYVFPLYIEGTKKSLWDVNNYIKAISTILQDCTEPVVMNDVKSHLRVFGPLNKPLNQVNPRLPNNLNIAQYSQLLRALLSSLAEPERWRELIGSSTPAYMLMEDRPIFLGEERIQPHYSFDTFSGRSKCTGFNMQGTTDTDDINTGDGSHVYVCLDWVSADIRVAAFLSKDKDLNDAYKESDPYAVMAEWLELPRKQCKMEFLKSLYTLDTNAPIFELFPTFKMWTESQLKSLRNNGYLSSALGRQFRVNTSDNRDEKSVFNAVVQGTVAHLMQASLTEMNKTLSQFLVSETHDSVILSCRPGMASHVINEAARIMIKPIDELPRFPVKAYIGRKWRQWKLYKEFR